MSPWYRVAGMALIGFSSGLLHTGIFQAISPMYRHDPAATVNLSGILFGLGCLVLALLVSGIYYIYTAPTIKPDRRDSGTAGWGHPHEIRAAAGAPSSFASDTG
jgi:hypothetical protein